MKKYDVIIVGAGPAGIFCAYELVKNREDVNILMLEKGRGIANRKCPKHTNGGICVHCKPCRLQQVGREQEPFRMVNFPFKLRNTLNI